MPVGLWLIEKCHLDCGFGFEKCHLDLVLALKNAIWTVISAHVIIVYICTYCLFLPVVCIREIVDSMSLVAKLSEFYVMSCLLR